MRGIFTVEQGVSDMSAEVLLLEEPEFVVVVDGFIPVPGPPGGGTRIQGELADVSELPDDADVGDAWVIDGDIWVWTETDTWFNAGPYVGPAGPARASRRSGSYRTRRTRRTGRCNRTNGSRRADRTSRRRWR